MIIAETRMYEMPKSCTECDLFNIPTLFCKPKQIMVDHSDFYWLRDERPEWCPLREENENAGEIQTVRSDADCGR